MISLATIGRLFTLLALLMAAWMALRPELTRERGGKVLAFMALFLLPVLATWGGGTEQMEASKETTFCLSCHVMQDYGRSLYYDDPATCPPRISRTGASRASRPATPATAKIGRAHV